MDEKTCLMENTTGRRQPILRERRRAASIRAELVDENCEGRYTVRFLRLPAKEEQHEVHVIAKNCALARGSIEIEEPEELKLGHQGTREVCRARAQEAPRSE